MIPDQRSTLLILSTLMISPFIGNRLVPKPSGRVRNVNHRTAGAREPAARPRWAPCSHQGILNFGFPKGNSLSTTDYYIAWSIVPVRGSKTARACFEGEPGT